MAREKYSHPSGHTVRKKDRPEVNPVDEMRDAGRANAVARRISLPELHFMRNDETTERLCRAALR